MGDNVKVWRLTTEGKRRHSIYFTNEISALHTLVELRFLAIEQAKFLGVPNGVVASWDHFISVEGDTTWIEVCEIDRERASELEFIR